MLYATYAPTGAEASNNLFGAKPYIEWLKRPRLSFSAQNGDAESKFSFVYAVREQRLCRVGSANLVALNEQTLARQAKRIALAP